MSEWNRRLGQALLPLAAFSFAAWRCAGLPMPTDTGFHLVRAGNRMLEGSMRGWALPPGGEHATPLGAIVAAFGALFADASEAKLSVSGCILFGLAAVILVRTLAKEDGPVIAITGLACLALPAGFASSFGSRPDAALGGLLLLVAAARDLRREPPVRVVLPLWAATLATPWAIPAALVAHAKHARDLKALVPPASVLALLAALSAAIPPPGQGEVIRGLFGDVHPSARSLPAAFAGIRQGWTEGIVLAAFLLSQIPRTTRLPTGLLAPWLCAAACAALLGAPGAFLGATALLAPVACLGLARAAARLADAGSSGPLRRPVVFLGLLSLFAAFLGAGPNRQLRSELRATAAREAQIGAFLSQEPAAGDVLAERTGAIAAFSGRPARSLEDADLAEPPTRWIVFSRGDRPGNDPERVVFTNPQFLRNFAPYPLRRGRRSETLDHVWIRRSSAGELPRSEYSAAIADAWSARDAADSLAAIARLEAAAAMEPPGLGLAHEELGLEWARRGEGGKSRALLEEARRRDPACVRARAILADRAISRGEILSADSLVTEIFAFHRGLAEYRGVRARLFAEAGWAENAETESDRAVRDGPEVARLLVNHGILLWRRGATSEAREFWRRAVRFDRSSLRYLGDFENAPENASAPPLGPVLSDFDFQPAPTPTGNIPQDTKKQLPLR